MYALFGLQIVPGYMFQSVQNAQYPGAAALTPLQ